MATFSIKRGDTAPALRYALFPDTLDLTGGTVVFNVRGLLDRRPATIITASPPVVEYQWQTGDLDSAGLFLAEFEVTYPDGRVETFPPDNSLSIHVMADLG